MRRILGLLLVLTLALSPACQKTAEDPALDKSLLQQIDSRLKASEPLLKKAESIIQWQLNLSRQELVKMKESLGSDTPFETIEEISETRRKARDLEKCLKELKELQRAVSLIPSGGSSRVDQTLHATRRYFERATAILEDLEAMLHFRLDLDELSESLNSFSSDNYEDASQMYEDFYYLIEDTVSAIKGLTYPSFMEATYSRYVDHAESFKAVVESAYLFEQLREMGITDQLRMYSISSILNRYHVKDLKFDIRLAEEVIFQNERFLDRLHSDLALLRKEIQSNLGLLLGSKEGPPSFKKYSYLTADKKLSVDFRYPDQIYPSLYPSLEAILIMSVTADGGDADVLLRAEIPGFTQVFEKKLTLTEQIHSLYLKPPLLPGDLDLDSSKEAQIVFSLTDLDSGRTYAKESLPIRLMSRYDFILWEDEFGTSNLDNAMAWLTPESEGILKLRRKAIEWLEKATDGAFDSLQGYQYSALFGPDEYYMNVVYQVLGLQGAMSEMGVRYNMGSFSMTQGWHQRVLLPDEVLRSKSGVCIETALVMASALQSANMHVMLVFPPGHAQVAVETWENSGEYYLVETTALPFSQEDDWDRVIQFLDSEEWEAYLQDPWKDGSGPCYVVDCAYANRLGFVGLAPGRIIRISLDGPQALIPS